MSLPRFKAKRDASEMGIVRALESHGCTVFRMAVPADLLVGFLGRNHICEVKTPGTSYGKDLNDNQKKFNDAWKGEGIWIVRTVEDVADVIKHWRFAE